MSLGPDELRLDLVGLRAHYAAGATPAEVIELLYARIESGRDPHVWIELVPKAEALAQARALGAFDPARPLWGVPFGVKDNVDVAGLPTSAACPAYAYQPTLGAPVVERVLAAGALCLGKTNMDQFATGLVGTRSPHGACRNVFDPRYLAGGSSSGSAVAVAAGQVSFAIGTDTAGSGRVPAALNNVVGLKPSRGLFPAEGLVPACRSLDSVSVFALGCADAARLRDVMHGAELPRAVRMPVEIGVPRASQLDFCGDAAAEAAFSAALARLHALGCTVHEIEWSPFAAIAALLYEGPWLAERLAAVGDFVRARPEACMPITREIILGAERYSGADVWRGLYDLERLRGHAEAAWGTLDGLVLPTTPTAYTLAEEAQDPRGINDRLGLYTRFLNFLGLPALAIPAGFKPNGLPFGITLVGRPGADAGLDLLARRFEHASAVGAGRSRQPVSVGPESEADGHGRRALRESARVESPPGVRLAVVGAHLRGQPLNHQLLAAGARFVRETRTAASYALYALAGTQPLKPGLARVREGGAPIAIEVWELPVAGFGAFVAAVPPPLCIGTLECEDGERVKGFLCEQSALEGAEEITRFGGFLAYLASQIRG
jgi:allophanate hydrolase